MLTELHAHWRAAIGIIALVVASMAVAYVTSSQSTRLYSADARLVVTSGLGSSGSSDAVLVAPSLGQTYAIVATTRPVLLDVIQQLGLLYDADELRSRLSVTGDASVPFLTITMTDEVPERAATVANALAETLVERATVPPTGIGDSTVPSRRLLEVLELATVPADPSAPRVLFNTLLAGAAALIAALALVAGMAYRRNVAGVRQKADL